jgi:hypothetical protein
MLKHVSLVEHKEEDILLLLSCVILSFYPGEIGHVRRDLRWHYTLLLRPEIHHGSKLSCHALLGDVINIMDFIVNLRLTSWAPEHKISGICALTIIQIRRDFCDTIFFKFQLRLNLWQTKFLPIFCTFRTDADAKSPIHIPNPRSKTKLQTCILSHCKRYMKEYKLTLQY